MTIAAEELSLLRINTTAFIDADSKQITLERRTTQSNGSGGFNETYTPLPEAQKMRLIPLGDKSPVRQTLDGEAAQPDYMLLGEWNADLQRWDKFEDQGHRYQVLFIHEKSSYERKGEVKYIGDADAP